MSAASSSACDAPPLALGRRFRFEPQAFAFGGGCRGQPQALAFRGRFRFHTEALALGRGLRFDSRFSRAAAASASSR